MNRFYLKISTVLIICLAVTACDSSRTSINPVTKIIRERQTITVWDRMANNIQINTHSNNPRVQKFIKMYTSTQAQNLTKFSEHATPYLYHIVTRLEELQLPTELALLPIVESEYRPLAVSNKGAAGLWQLAAMTGRIYGLKQDYWYDGRKDVDAATKAALGHLAVLAEKFNNDWLLALAAYNCGDARVAQAIRKNKARGLPTDYWSLSLPKETMYFVPKFLALTYLLQNQYELGINLAPIANRPYFTKISLSSQINLNTAAELAKLDVKEIKKLNPAYRMHVTHPEGPHQILLPVKHANIFRNNFAAKKVKPI